ncbi:MAG: UvrD-helicase domain-containing protein, partial [Muribaculaceae bacterium]|nr:UvrD-helicase domain-containing protein [Muribaculaceae bacterium]
YYTNVLLRDNPDVLNHYREYFQYVLVDEYQDTNFAQHLIVSQLTHDSQRLCVVGDDAQSIYSFRGANIRNILNLKKSYPDLKIFKLEQNYRSTQNIINAANSLIDKNTEQIRKQVFSRNEPGRRIEVVQSYSDYEEGYLVANRIALLRTQQHDSYEDYAILYRTNAQSRVLEESLRKRNIPYRIYGGLSFYQRKEVKDAIAYFRLSLNQNDDEALRRVINYPARGIGETTVNKLVRAALDNKVSIWDVIIDLKSYDTGLNSAAERKLGAFRDMIERFSQMNSDGLDAVTVATSIIGETRLLSVLLTDRAPESISKQENIEELLKGVKEFVDDREEEGVTGVTLGDFLGEVSLATDQDSQDTDMQAEERVTLMTVHAAKGLEFGNVFVVGVEEELFPSAMSCDTIDGVEEERRLLYVALTRAKRFCMMSYAASRFRNGQTMTCSPSRFLRDIDPKYLQLTSGTTLGSLNRSFVNPVEHYRSSFHSPAAAKVAAEREAVRRSLTGNQSKSADNTGGLHVAAELSVGMTVEHNRFGLGRIQNIEVSPSGDRITVDFDNTGTKVLLLKFARFNIKES